MSWRGPRLEQDQRDLRAMLGEFANDHDVEIADDPAVVEPLVAELVELGVWTLGAAEEHGGAGADRATTSVALIEVSRSWPALGLAAVQAHAAVSLLAGDDHCADLVRGIHAGTAALAVVDARSSHVHLHRSGDTLQGSVDRVDVAAEAPHLLVLSGEDEALLIDPSATRTAPVARAGLAGALTRSLDVHAGAHDVVVLAGVDVAAARGRLRLGIAAVAAGIAAAAADAAADYAATRHQFGDALTAIPTVRQSLLHQAERVSIVLDAVVAGDEDPVRSLATARAACEGAIEVAAAALQSHGGYGYLAEYPAERHLRDAVSLRAAADLPGGAVATARTLVDLPPTVSLDQEAS